MKHKHPKRNAGATFAMIITAGITISSIGTAGPSRAHGALCNPSNPADASKLANNAFGVHNSSNASAQVTCGVPLELNSLSGGAATARVISAHAIVSDRNSNAAVCCTLRLMSADTNFLNFTQQRCTGVAQNQSDPIGLTFIGIGFAGSNTGSAVVECTLPASTASGVSHVNTYYVNSNPE